MKTPETEHQYHKLEYSRPQIENPDFIKIKIDKMKQNMIIELAKVTNARQSTFRKFLECQNNLMQIKMANFPIKDLLQDFKPNLTLLNKICDFYNKKASKTLY